MGATQTFFVLKLANLLNISKPTVRAFSLMEIATHYFFCAQFRIPWILCWDFCSHHVYPSPFPQHLAREFKIKWWAAFKISQAQIFNEYTKFSIVYIDDVLIFSNSIEERFKHLKNFQKIVRDNGLVISSTKIKLFKQTLGF